jgi:hypothetical protein
VRGEVRRYAWMPGYRYGAASGRLGGERKFGRPTSQPHRAVSTKNGPVDYPWSVSSSLAENLLGLQILRPTRLSTVPRSWSRCSGFSTLACRLLETNRMITIGCMCSWMTCLPSQSLLLVRPGWVHENESGYGRLHFVYTAKLRGRCWKRWIWLQMVDCDLFSD